MKSRIAGIISGAAITASIAVAAFSLVGTADAKSPSPVHSQTQMMTTHGDRGRPDLSNVASALGLLTDELRTQLQSGKSLADIAKAQSVDVAKVIDAIVTDIKTKLATEVASGEHTQAEVDAKLAQITTRVTEMVNNGRPGAGMGFGGCCGHGSHHQGQESNA